MEIEVSKDDSEERVDTLVELAKIFDLTSENQESKLRVSEENDQKHDHKSANILCRARKGLRKLEFDEWEAIRKKCGTYLIHSCVKADVFEKFNPGEENHNRHDVHVLEKVNEHVFTKRISKLTTPSQYAKDWKSA